MGEIDYFNEEQTDYSEYLIKESLKKRYILDASVISKWYYKKDEEDLHNASLIYDKLKSEKYILFAPDLLVYELLNIFRTKSEISDEKISEILTELYNSLVILGINKNLLTKSFLTSRRLDITVYDSIYLTLSEDLAASLITADKKLYHAAKNSNYNSVLLSDFVREYY
ncbi:MAG: type II toxin-antitoxin system VapC family toxin [Actinobacteria bacterium]|nr:type II toxin-antitoxin system VapC family toxin [Actinomycetota bacterium]MCL5987271.1 type II toxin-antitoxin system VapC family toxin [Actinomycetota bacterium]